MPFRAPPCSAPYCSPIYGGAITSHMRLEDPLFSHTLFGVYLGLLAWGGLWFRDERVRALLPFRR